MILRETKPLLLLSKYRSVFLSALSVEIVAYVTSLTDSIIAGNFIDAEAFSAISLFSPFVLISSFVAAVVNSGTLINYNKEIGRFNKKRADEFFSQGIVMALIFGALLTLTVLIIKPVFILMIHTSLNVLYYLSKYYNIAVFYLFFFPVSCILSNIVISDGGEKVSAFADIMCICLNIVLSVIMTKPYGIIGIAAATLISKVFYIFLISCWFLNKNNTIRFIAHFSKNDFFNIISKGSVRASKFFITALSMWTINVFVLAAFDDMVYQIWAVCQNIIGLSAVFLGLSMTLQPLIGALISENNTKAIRFLIKRLGFDIAVISFVCFLLTFAFPEAVFNIFGISDPMVINNGISAVRIIGFSIIIAAQLTLFFVYCFLMDKPGLTISISAVSDFLLPVITVLTIWITCNKSTYCIWAGFLVSEVLSVMIFAAFILKRYGREQFPLMISKQRNDDIHIFSFIIEKSKSSEASETAISVFEKDHMPKRIQMMAGMCIEDFINLIYEQNRPEKILLECTIIKEKDGERVVFRDNGKRLNILNNETEKYSFLRYIVVRVIAATEYASYISTAGYNRNEMFFKKEMETDK